MEEKKLYPESEARDEKIRAKEKERDRERGNLLAKKNVSLHSRNVRKRIR